MAHGPGDPATCVGGAPWLHPGTDAFLKILDDPIGDPRVNVGTVQF